MQSECRFCILIDIYSQYKGNLQGRSPLSFGCGCLQVSGFIGLKTIAGGFFAFCHQFPHSYASTMERIDNRKVDFLTLLSVGSDPAVGWHSHYYALRKLLPCRREVLLAQMARMLFGPQNTARIMGLAKLLANVLDSEFTPNSLMGHSGFSPGGIEAPLLICCRGYDTIVDPNTHGKWQQ